MKKNITLALDCTFVVCCIFMHLHLPGPEEAVCFCFCLFVFVALRPKSTAMVIAGRSVHLTTLFPGQA